MEDLRLRMVERVGWEVHRQAKTKLVFLLGQVKGFGFYLKDGLIRSIGL